MVFKVGMKVKKKRSACDNVYIVCAIPGMREYDSMGFLNARNGMLLRPADFPEVYQFWGHQCEYVPYCSDEDGI